jgi:hypothetical protein
MDWNVALNIWGETKQELMEQYWFSNAAHLSLGAS